jgi:hypothetical protein
MRYEYARPLHHVVRSSCCARRIVIASPALVNMRLSEGRDRFAGIEDLVDQNIASWNRVTSWLKQLDAFRVAS